MRKIVIYAVLIVTVMVAAYIFFRPKSISPTSEPMVHSFTITDEKTFLENMIPHHQEAVDTSKLVLSETRDAELQKFTKGVVDSQTNEINQMKEWLLLWYKLQYYPNSNYEPMMGNLSDFRGVKQEKVYVEGMIRHHMGAIEMAKKVLSLSPREEVKKLAEDIVSAQESEIKILQEWLDKKYSGVSGEDKTMHEINVH